MESLDRFHDLERTMQLNYFGSAQLIHRLLPSMLENKRGQIINISSIAVLGNGPRIWANLIEAWQALGTPLYEGFGQSEFMSGTVNLPGHCRVGTVGRVNAVGLDRLTTLSGVALLIDF